jgi:hypothetical protein
MCLLEHVLNKVITDESILESIFPASDIRPAFVGWHPLGLATPGAPDGCRLMKAVLAS